MKPTDFQEATADRILELFESGQLRVLLADEVGLGKTIMARAVVQKTAERLQRPGKCFKVIYICSNLNIARQNCEKLGIQQSSRLNFAEGRLSMQHLRIYETSGLETASQQLIPMTPATSFSMTLGRGTQEERALIYAILSQYPALQPYSRKLKDLMKMDWSLTDWDGYVNAYKARVKACASNNRAYLPDMLRELDRHFKEYPELMEDILQICSERSVRSVDYAFRRDTVNGLRRAFAQISLNRLEPDLVIMDEFQRFSELIKEDGSEGRMIAKQFFSQSSTRVLLLSATPYKPYSTLEELADGGSDHYDEFMQVMDFLFRDENKRTEFHNVWQAYSEHLSELKTDDLTVLIAYKDRAEEAMYQGVCRTERSGNGIIDSSKAAEMQDIATEDILSYIENQRLMDELGLGKFPIEYVKSAPYLLSFMNYKVKESIFQKLKTTNRYDLLRHRSTLFLSKKQINNYNEIPCCNARLQMLFNEAFGQGRNGAELLLWIPASRPYYTVNNVFSQNAGYSKTLVFSSWEMVPRVIAGMTSYESERLTMFRLGKRKDAVVRKYFAQEDPSKGTKKKRSVSVRLRDEMEAVLEYPSRRLANLYDPIKLGGMSLSAVRKAVGAKVKKLLEQLRADHSLSTGHKGAAHILALLKTIETGRLHGELRGIPPGADDLLTDLAIGSPGICALRLFKDEVKAREYAKKMVSLFNKPESNAVIDVLYGIRNDDAYYENVIRYCVEGNLQAVLDEYAFTLSVEDEELSDEMKAAFLDSAQIQIETLESCRDNADKPRLRTHFAVGYFNALINEKTAQRTESVRKAFNSPFRPFVLATTSIGQEGLDFHTYCRKIMHWNLPSNPIDLEQREGRINRYLCHAIRQNLAESRYGQFPFQKKVWPELMQRASAGLKGTNSDLVPYWYLPDDFPYTRKIERIVPMYPFSQDRCRYEHLLEVLSAYRLTLGQPRQEELFEILKKEHWDSAQLQRLYINLSPWSKRRRPSMLRSAYCEELLIRNKAKR